MLEFQQQEVDSLQHKVTTLRSELKTEMKLARQANEAQVRRLLLFLLFLYFADVFVFVISFVTSTVNTSNKCSL